MPAFAKKANASPMVRLSKDRVARPSRATTFSLGWCADFCEGLFDKFRNLAGRVSHSTTCI